MVSVDDDRRVLDSLAMLMESAGYTPQSFTSAEGFLQSPALAAAACVIADVRMPGLDGLELQRRIRLVRPELPVIVISAHGDDAGTESGAAGWRRRILRQAIRLRGFAHRDQQSVVRAVERTLPFVVAALLNKETASDLATSEIRLLSIAMTLCGRGAGSLADPRANGDNLAVHRTTRRLNKPTIAARFSASYHRVHEADGSERGQRRARA